MLFFVCMALSSTTQHSTETLHPSHAESVKRKGAYVCICILRAPVCVLFVAKRLSCARAFTRSANVYWTGYAIQERAQAVSELNLIIAIRQQNTEILTETLNKGKLKKKKKTNCVL